MPECIKNHLIFYQCPQRRLVEIPRLTEPDENYQLSKFSLTGLNSRSNFDVKKLLGGSDAVGQILRPDINIFSGCLLPIIRIILITTLRIAANSLYCR